MVVESGGFVDSETWQELYFRAVGDDWRQQQSTNLPLWMCERPCCQRPLAIKRRAGRKIGRSSAGCRGKVSYNWQYSKYHECLPHRVQQDDRVRLSTQGLRVCRPQLLFNFVGAVAPACQQTFTVWEVVVLSWLSCPSASLRSWESMPIFSLCRVSSCPSSGLCLWSLRGRPPLPCLFLALFLHVHYAETDTVLTASTSVGLMRDRSRDGDLRKIRSICWSRRWWDSRCRLSMLQTRAVARARFVAPLNPLPVEFSKGLLRSVSRGRLNEVHVGFHGRRVALGWCPPVLGSVARQSLGWSPLREVPARRSRPWPQHSHNAAGSSTGDSGPDIPPTGDSGFGSHRDAAGTSTSVFAHTQPVGPCFAPAPRLNYRTRGVWTCDFRSQRSPVAPFATTQAGACLAAPSPQHVKAALQQHLATGSSKKRSKVLPCVLARSDVSVTPSVVAVTVQGTKGECLMYCVRKGTKKRRSHRHLPRLLDGSQRCLQRGTRA